MSQKVEVDYEANMHLHVLLVEEVGTYIAHCLEIGTSGQGKTEKEAIEDLIGCIHAHIEESIETGAPESIFNPAPPEYWQMYYNSLITKARNRSLINPRFLLKGNFSNLEVVHA
jgi:predicted RNase H-like HicB family nuclease